MHNEERFCSWREIWLIRLSCTVGRGYYTMQWMDAVFNLQVYLHFLKDLQGQREGDIRESSIGQPAVSWKELIPEQMNYIICWANELGNNRGINACNNLWIICLAAFFFLSVYSILIFVLRETIHLFRHIMHHLGVSLRYSGQLLLTLRMSFIMTEIWCKILVLCRNEYKTKWWIDLLPVGMEIIIYERVLAPKVRRSSVDCCNCVHMRHIWFFVSN